jgi:hypothetical protein
MIGMDVVGEKMGEKVGEKVGEKMGEEKPQELVQIIRQWMKNDRDMTALKKELAKRRAEQNVINGKLIGIMRDQELPDAYVQKTQKRAISKKSIVPILTRYYKGDAAKVSELSQFIFDNRETVIQEKIALKKGAKS